MKKAILVMLAVAVMAVAAHKVAGPASHATAHPGDTTLVQTVQAGGLVIQTKTTLSEEGKTLKRAVQLESPFGPIELFTFGRD